MLTIIIYDIEETKNRNNVIKKLRHYGLKRIQKSAFRGNLKQDQRNTLKEKLEENILSQKDSIIQIEICASCKEHITQLGNSETLQEEEKEYEVLI